MYKFFGMTIIVSDKMFSSLYNSSGYNSVIVKVDNIEAVKEVREEIEDRLNKREEDVRVMELKMIVEGIKSLFRTISVFLLGIGAISLLVAGISILNVMMMSTVERTKGIGVMRAIGASRSGILRMFLFESLILGAIGGVIGAILGFGAGFFGGRFDVKGSVISVCTFKYPVHIPRDCFRGRNECNKRALSCLSLIHI